MARSAVLTTTSTNSKKRKSTGGLDALGKSDEAGNKRRKTLEAYFAPQVTPVSSTKSEKGSVDRVALNAEQIRVLQMVVDEGKNVFFTGAAGEWHLRVTFLCLSYAICRCVNSVRTECCEYCYEASPLNLSSGSVPRIVYVLPQTLIYAPVIEFSRWTKACVVL